MPLYTSRISLSVASLASDGIIVNYVHLTTLAHSMRGSSQDDRSSLRSRVEITSQNPLHSPDLTYLQAGPVPFRRSCFVKCKSPQLRKGSHNRINTESTDIPNLAGDAALLCCVIRSVHPGITAPHTSDSGTESKSCIHSTQLQVIPAFGSDKA